jgi:hypothetical protein
LKEAIERRAFLVAVNGIPDFGHPAVASFMEGNFISGNIV